MLCTRFLVECKKPSHYSFVNTLFFSVDPEIEGYHLPNFIVFWHMLVSLFSMFCFKCRQENLHIQHIRMVL